jgi:hypothetical protein
VAGSSWSHQGRPASAWLSRLCVQQASTEYDDPAHPARAQARGYRQALRGRLTRLAAKLDPGRRPALGGQLAVLEDGAYTSAAHLEAGRPGRGRAAAGPPNHPGAPVMVGRKAVAAVKTARDIPSRIACWT